MGEERVREERVGEERVVVGDEGLICSFKVSLNSNLVILGF